MEPFSAKRVIELSDAAKKITDDKKFNYKTYKIDYAVDTRGYKNERKTFNFIKRYNKLHTEKLTF